MARQLGNLLVNRIHDRYVGQAAARYFNGRLLDIGCGEKPMLDLVAPYVREHVGIDHPQTLHDASKIDVFSDAYNVPFRDGAFDSVLCTAVLEHLEEPERALAECHRLLRPGGCAVYTAPFIWHVHEAPRDFFRYSPYGLRHLFSKVGFEVVEVVAMSGFWVTFGQLLAYNVSRLNKGPIRRLHLLDPLLLLIQGSAYLMDRIDRTEKWSWAHLVVARRPPETGAQVSAQAELSG